jgi:23S rRNA (uracil1939-C5)-methyltransferase
MPSSSSRRSVADRLTIARLGHRGDGVADGSAGPIYVPGALPGETVEVEAVVGHPDRRRVLQVDVPSADRIAPICPHFGVCGGCAIQHYDTARYGAWKRDLVVAALRQASIEAPVAALIDAHGRGRRRAVFHARRGSHDVIEVGFSAARSHHLVAIDRCPILAPELDGAIGAAWAIAETLQGAGKPLDIQVTATDAGLDVDVRGSGPLTPVLMSELARVAEKHDLARLTRHGELIALRRPPTLRMGKATVPLPPAAFLQATAEGEDALARLVLAPCTGAGRIADLFSGVGPFALRLAERARILAIDDDEPALAALKRAAATTPGLKPISIERRDLFRRPLTAADLKGFDAVVFDPPRQGAEMQARELSESGTPLVVAVSCNPGTFARDLQPLLRAGYHLAEVTPIDQFRYSAHVEIVATLEK